MTVAEQKIFYIKLGERIKEARKVINMKQEDLAKLLRLSRVSVVNIEKGRQRPPLHVIYEISSITNTPISDIFPMLDHSKKVDQPLKKKWQQKISRSISDDNEEDYNLLKNLIIKVTGDTKDIKL